MSEQKKEKVNSKPKADSQAEPKAESKKALVPKDVDIHQYITVKNGFQGRLVYVSKRTGETITWDGFGDEQDMELLELKSSRNSNKNFFTNNWFMFDEDWVIEYLGVRQFYKNAIPIDRFDDIFNSSADEVNKIISGLSKGQKQSVAYRAKQLIASGDIDSNKVINALEKALNIELIER